MGICRGLLLAVAGICLAAAGCCGLPNTGEIVRVELSIVGSDGNAATSNVLGQYSVATNTESTAEKREAEYAIIARAYDADGRVVGSLDSNRDYEWAAVPVDGANPHLTWTTGDSAPRRTFRVTTEGKVDLSARPKGNARCTGVTRVLSEKTVAEHQPEAITIDIASADTESGAFLLTRGQTYPLRVTGRDGNSVDLGPVLASLWSAAIDTPATAHLERDPGTLDASVKAVAAGRCMLYVNVDKGSYHESVAAAVIVR